MADAQQSARALYEAGALEYFVTSFTWHDSGHLSSLFNCLPFKYASELRQQFARRAITEVPFNFQKAYPNWEIARTVANKIIKSPILTDKLWDRGSKSFDKYIASQFVPTSQAIQSFEYTALESFKMAQGHGIARILHLPSLDSRAFESIRRREHEMWPKLSAPSDDYFLNKFETRYNRRRLEIELADVVIANSSLTKASHVQAGLNPSKVFVVPLAAPPAIANAYLSEKLLRSPLRVLYAGTFSIGKGAHYLLEAWRLLNAGSSARLDVYGQQLLPRFFINAMEDGIVFHGSVPKRQLFKAYQEADILVFPTLSDGFGMVVTEAMAHGLPVILTDQAGAADLVTNENGFIIPAANPIAISDALGWCLDNRVRLAEMRHNALETARSRQWGDFRRDLINCLTIGLKQSGYQPTYHQLP